MNVVWVPSAQRQLDRAHDALEGLSPSGAARLVDEVTRAARRIGAYPDSGRIVPEFQIRTLREVIVGRYRLVYERFPDRVEILAFHPSAIPF